MKPTERDAQLTIADRIRLQVKQLGLLCPEVLLKQDSTFSLSPEYEVYWQRFTRSTASLQFWHILYIRAWEHEPGMFDIVVISATRTTMKTAKEPLLHVDDSPTILNWGRNYRADRLADFASSTVDKLLATFRIGK